MTLPPGSRLGAYEILAPLGAGGMGEVYRARDTRLNRELAIKVLPASVAKDPEFLARFQSEARAASALNHPNIITIHDIGSADGVSFILMELVIGKTVRQLLDGGPPPLKKTLQIATQAADGLAAAHARGIVHRDLKPENLMVSRDGVVKILDFGLAKTTPLRAAPGERTGSYEAVPTQPGSVLGTVGYMSPEQASGRSVDFRSDQFSFGTILHEMVTGRRVWKRDSAAETLTAIIREDPDPLATAAPDTPTALRWIVDRCLAKDPEERYASTRDLARDLATLKDHLGEVSGAGPRSDGGNPLAPAPRGRRFFVMGALGVAALGAAILLATLLRKPDAAELGPDRFSSRRRLVRPLCPRRPDDRLQRGLGRQSRAALLDAAAVDRNADARPAARKAPGDFAGERARLSSRPSLRQVLRSAGHAREGRARRGRRAGHPRERAGGGLVSRRDATRRRPRGRGKSQTRIPDRQETLRDRSADQQPPDFPGRCLDRLLRGRRRGVRGGGACFRRPPASPLRGLVPERRRPRLVRRWPRDLVYAAEAGSGQQPASAGCQPLRKAEGGRPGSRPVASLRHRPRRAPAARPLGPPGRPSRILSIHRSGARALRHRRQSPLRSLE